MVIGDFIAEHSVARPYKKHEKGIRPFRVEAFSDIPLV